MVFGALLPAHLRAAEVTVAVASNFLTTAEVIAESFEAETGHELRLAHGSTGRLYAQVLNGAPFDVFLAADQERPALLEADGLTLARKPYAIGRLVLVAAPELGLAMDRLGEGLQGRRIALAEPKVAPYGLAAEEVLISVGLPPDGDGARFLFGESVGQVANIFATGNAEAAFVAAAQLLVLDIPEAEALPLDGLHVPIVQDAVLLARAEANPAARAFYDYLSSEAATVLLQNSGYDAP